MKITQIHTNKPQSLSFEIFPPKKEEDFKNIDEMLEILCDCHPEYISVTFGAGGSSNNNKTIEIAKKIKNQYNVEPVVHLTCLCYNKAEIDEFTRQLSYEGIENILALRGDRNPNVPAKEDFLHASDLIKYIKDTTGDQFCIAGACYPDIHPEAADKVDDIKNLKKRLMPVQSFFYRSSSLTMIPSSILLRIAGLQVSMCLLSQASCLVSMRLRFREWSQCAEQSSRRSSRRLCTDTETTRRHFLMPECLTARVR